MEREQSNSKKPFKILRELTEKRTMTAGVINDVDGNTLMEAEDIKRRWAEYCENLYKCQQQEDEGRHLSEDNVAEESPPLRSEVSWAMDKIKNGKSPGIDDIPIKLLKAAGEEGVTIMWRLCKMIWHTRQWPLDWSRAVFVPLPKERELEGVLQPSYHQPEKSC